MEKLIKLKTFCELEIEKASKEIRYNNWRKVERVSMYHRIRQSAFSDIIDYLDLILNNSCVKPLDSRSPEGQGCQAGVSRPNDSQNPNSENPD